MKTFKALAILSALLCATTNWAGPILPGSGTKDDPYLIGSLKDWREFSIYVGNNYTPFDECYKLTADIGPINDINYIIGYLDHPFKGIFDGDGHTLTMDFDSDTYGYVSPFFNIYDATIKNLHVTGEVTAAEPYAAGLVQEVESYYGNTIENCRVSTKIICNATTSGECIIGGFVGSNPDMDLNITGCVFDGQIIAPNLTGCAGFVGWNDADRRGNVNITDCVFAPTALNVKGGMTFVRSSKYGEDFVKISNSYYTTLLGNVQGKKAHAITGSEGVTVAMAGEATEYNMSQITAYSGNAGLKYNDIIYAGSGDVVSLNLSSSGYAYTSSTGTLSGVVNPFTLTMADADVVVSNSDIVIVKTDQELRTVLPIDGVKILLANDIDLSNSTLSIASGKTVTIDLGGYTLDRKLTKRGEGGGQVITVRNGATLNLSNGTLKGGWGGAGGALVNEGGMVTLTDVIITHNVADDRGGGICNREGGTLTMTGGVITDNSSNDKTGAKGGGGFFNEVNATATLTGVTITGNKNKTYGGGGICNFGTLTIDGCTITGNTAGANGGAIWQEGTLNLQGKNTITDNQAGGKANNIYLYNTVITVTGSLTGSSIGVSMEHAVTFTSGYNTYNEGVDPATIFSSDDAVFYVMRTADETCLALDYVVCSWDDESKVVKSEIKTLASGNYTVLKGGGDIDLQPGYYIVKSNVTYGTINMKGSGTHHLILCDGARIKANFIHIIDDDVLHIYGQTNSSGQLIIDEPLLNCAGIGCTSDESVGTIVIHGGDISAHSDGGSAGIGSSNYSSGSHGSSWRVPRHRSDLSSADDGTITIYDGTVKAYGGTNGSGIGGGRHTRSGTITINGGKVYAYGGDDAAGIGGGWDTSGYSLVVNGGYVEAHGGGNGAGIGSGSVQIDNGKNVVGGEVTINGGEVYAYGGVDAAGIGGGEDGHGGTITITGGYVYAEGNDYGSAIGGGQDGDGGNITITGGTVIAKAGANAPGAIGGGEDGEHGSLTLGDDRCAYITNNLWRCKKENRVNDCWGAAYLQISECLHGDATVSIVSGDKHNMSNCKWCYVTGEEAHTFGEDGQCPVCKLIRLEDQGDNSALFSKWADGEAHDFLFSGRKLEADTVQSSMVNGQSSMVNGQWQPRAYTVCLPFDMDLTGRDDLMLYTLSYIKDGSEMVFTQTAKKIEAGKPYLIVIHQGELELMGHSKLITTASEGVRVYDWENRDQPLGWWRGTLTKIESADAAAMMAYALQSVGDFRRIRPDTPQAWWGAFRSMYCPDELPGTNRFTINKGTFGGFGGQTVTVTFEGDADIQDGTGIDEIKNEQLIINNEDDAVYDLSGRRINSKFKIATSFSRSARDPFGVQNSKLPRGIYINNGRKIIIK